MGFKTSALGELTVRLRLEADKAFADEMSLASAPPFRPGWNDTDCIARFHRRGTPKKPGIVARMA
jgi:hypothetical protein